MRRAVVLAALAALLLPGQALARECGIPDANPLWVDFAGHDAPLPQKPGLTLAFTSGTVKPAEAFDPGALAGVAALHCEGSGAHACLLSDPARAQPSRAGRPAARRRRGYN